MIPQTSELLIPSAIARLRLPDRPRAAVFDADGTLWSGDVSEDFTRWMIGRGLFDEALWPQYEAVNARDPAAGCFEILRFYAGLETAAIRTHVADYWAAQPEREWNPRVLAALVWLQQKGCAVWIVSGTPALVLEPMAARLPVRGILALDLEMDEAGKATGKHAGIAPVAEGKCLRIRKDVPHPVVLAAGNSHLDVPMLEMSWGIAWAVRPDAELRQVAVAKSWLITDE